MYQEITKDEYRGYFTNIKFDPFLPTDIEVINSVISKYYKYYRQKYPSSDDIHIIIHPLSGRKLEYLFDSDKWLYDIDKIMDEWFLVRDQIDDKCYKCDQLSGLLNFLEDRMPKLKHIKTFENISMGYSGDGYQSISFHHFLSEVKKPQISWTQSDVDKITSLFDNLPDVLVQTMDSSFGSEINEKNILVIKYDGGDEDIIQIFCMYDDWYIVRIGMDTYYKCDQIYGLSNLIKSILNNFN